MSPPTGALRWKPLTFFESVRILWKRLPSFSPPWVLDAEVEPLAGRIVSMVGETTRADELRNLEVLRSWSGPIEVAYPAGYAPLQWADIVRDHTDLVVKTLFQQLGRSELGLREIAAQEGEVQGVTFRVEGSGPPLILFPISLVPSQWNPAIERLNEQFTTVSLGGPHLGAVALLERRAFGGTYIQGVRTMFDLLEMKRGDDVLEVGTGSGALARDLASRVSGLRKVVGVDINEYLLGEAANFASKASLSSPLRYEYGNAESLPFESESFDAAFAVTCFEECNADRAIAELQRVLRPGGRAGVVIRSKDLPWYWNLDISDQLKAKINIPYPSAGVSAGGCVDSSLYTRFAHQFQSITPSVFWNSLPDVVYAMRNNPVQQGLTESEQREFDAAIEAGERSGTSFAATPYHCVVGTKAT